MNKFQRGKDESGQFAGRKAIQLTSDTADQDKWPVLYLLADGGMPVRIFTAKETEQLAAALCKILLFINVLHSVATEKCQSNQRVDQTPKSEVAHMDLDW